MGPKGEMKMEDFYKHKFMQKMIALSIVQGGIPNSKIDIESLLSVMGPESKVKYRNYVESHPSIKSKVTDKDMILCQIDWALENGDRNLFMKLTKELKEMEKYEKTTKVH